MSNIKSEVVPADPEEWANAPAIPAMLKERLSFRAMDLKKVDDPDMDGDKAVKLLDDYEKKAREDVKRYGPKYERYADKYINDVMQKMVEAGEAAMSNSESDSVTLPTEAIENLIGRVEALEKAAA